MLDVTQPAIIRHLRILQEAGLIESYNEDNPLGAARKYYRICKSFNLEIALEPQDFDVRERRIGKKCPVYEEKRELLEELAQEINLAAELDLKASMARTMLDEVEPLLSCRDFVEGDPNCIRCHTMATLNRRVSQVILQISRGEIGSSLKTLSDTINYIINPESFERNRE